MPPMSFKSHENLIHIKESPGIPFSVNLILCGGLADFIMAVNVTISAFGRLLCPVHSPLIRIIRYF